MTTETKQQPAPRWYKIAVALIVLAFAILNGVTLGNKSLWIDEMRTGYATMQHSPAALLHYIILNDPASPLYDVCITAFSRVVGTGDAALRVPSLLFAILSILAFSILSRRLLQDDMTSFIAIFIFSFSVNAFYFSQEARAYSLFVFLALAAYLLCLELVENNRLWPAFGAVCLLGVYSHVFFVFVITNCALYALIYRNMNNPGWKKATLASILSGVLYIPWIIVLLKVSADPSRTPPIFNGFFKTFITIFAGLLNGNAYTDIRIAAQTAAASLIFLLTGFILKSAIPLITRRLLILWIVAPLVFAFVFMHLFRGVYGFFHFRYLIHLQPLLIIVMAAGIVYFARNHLLIRKTWLRPRAILNLCFIYLTLAWVFGTVGNLSAYRGVQHQNWRGAWRHINKNAMPHDMVVLQGIAASSIGYYENKDGAPVDFLSTNRVSLTADTFASRQRKWIVYYRDNWRPEWFALSREQIDPMLMNKKVFKGLLGDVIVGFSDAHTLVNELDLHVTNVKDPGNADAYFFPGKDAQIEIPCFNMKKDVLFFHVFTNGNEILSVQQDGRMFEYGVMDMPLMLKQGRFKIIVRRMNNETSRGEFVIHVGRGNPVDLIDEGIGPEYGNYFLDWIRQ